MNSPDSVTGRRLAIVALAGAALVLGAWAVVASVPSACRPSSNRSPGGISTRGPAR